MYTFNHMSLVVSDCQRSADFYTEVLGCRIIDQSNSESLKIVLLQTGPLIIELLEYIPAPSARHRAGVHDHLAFTVPDLEAAVIQLKSKGLQFETDSPRLISNGKKIIFFAGPDNERIELIEG